MRAAGFAVFLPRAKGTNPSASARLKLIFTGAPVGVARTRVRAAKTYRRLTSVVRRVGLTQSTQKEFAKEQELTPGSKLRFSRCSHHRTPAGRRYRGVFLACLDASLSCGVRRQKRPVRTEKSGRRKKRRKKNLLVCQQGRHSFHLGTPKKNREVPEVFLFLRAMRKWACLFADSLKSGQ